MLSDLTIEWFHFLKNVVFSRVEKLSQQIWDYVDLEVAVNVCLVSEEISVRREQQYRMFWLVE